MRIFENEKENIFNDVVTNLVNINTNQGNKAKETKIYILTENALKHSHKNYLKHSQINVSKHSH